MITHEYRGAVRRIDRPSHSGVVHTTDQRDATAYVRWNGSGEYSWEPLSNLAPVTVVTTVKKDWLGREVTLTAESPIERN